MEPEDADAHHLIPKHKGGNKGPVAVIHRFCHTKIHSVFTNGELKKAYSTIDAIRAHPDMTAFVEWVQGKPSNFYMKNSQSNKRRGKN